MPVSLDDFLSSYQSDFAYSLDNRLLLTWYPHRIARVACGDSALELGLGHGYTTAIFAQHFARLQVIEGSPAIIERFRQQHPEVCADIVPALFEEFTTEERFDCIIMGFVLEHVDDPALVLQRFRQHLKPGGSLFVAVPNAECLNRRIGHAAGMLDDIAALGAGDRLLGHQRYFTIASLRALLAQQGYTILREEGIFLKPLSTQQLLQLSLPEEVLQAFLEVGVGYPELCAGILVEAEPTA